MQRRLECLGRALVDSGDRRRQAHLGGRLVDLLDRIADGDPGPQVERKGDRRQLAEMIDR